ncbi:hypothetical protein [Kitasatospora sp. NPDC050463]|uniref:hypothetical protein n=1 Tax=Kitasatospora sp. NPDC050463 TaxID=3155786 RepID=UPI0033ED0D54
MLQCYCNTGRYFTRLCARTASSERGSTPNTASRNRPADEAGVERADLLARRRTPLPLPPLTGIHGCRLLHSEYDDLDYENDTAADAEDWTDEQAEQHQQRSRERFAQLVRETAAANSDRLI